MMKRCKCLPVDRKASFLTLNGQNIYMCTKCGRYHDTRHLPKHWDLTWAIVFLVFLLLLVSGLLFLGR